MAPAPKKRPVVARAPQKNPLKNSAKETAKEADTAGGLSSLWFQFLNGLRF